MWKCVITYKIAGRNHNEHEKGVNRIYSGRRTLLIFSRRHRFFDPAANAAAVHQTKIDTAADTYIVKAGELNVRKEPNKQGSIIGTLRSEDSVKVKRLQGADWAEIDYKGHKAYISTHFLMKQPVKAVTAKQTAFIRRLWKPANKGPLKRVKPSMCSAGGSAMTEGLTVNGRTSHTAGKQVM